MDRSQLEAACKIFIAKAQEPNTATILITLLALLVTTRFLTAKSESGPDGARLPPRPGYWVPILGHVPQMSLGRDGYLAKLRRNNPKGAFVLQLAGKVHTYIYRPSLVTALMEKPRTVADGEVVSRGLLRSNFAFSRQEVKNYENAQEEIHEQLKYIKSEGNQKELTKAKSIELRNHVADLVTYNIFPADQMEWERLAGGDVTESSAGKIHVEVDLLELIKNFVAKMTNPAIFGSDFVEKFPDFSQLLWHYDNGFIPMAKGIPWWIPYPPVQRAKFSQRKLLSYLTEFHEALEKYFNGDEPGAEWTDMDNVSAFIKHRAMTFRKHKLPIATRAKSDLEILWALNTKSTPLIFWLVYEIARDSTLLAQIREEITPHIEAVRPKNEFGPGVWLAPCIKKLDIDALLTECPLLKSSYIETLRMYSALDVVKYMKEDVVLKDKDEGYKLPKGTYVHIPQELHQFDPTYFSDPHDWQAKRHMKETVDKDGKKTFTAELGTLEPYGDGSPIWEDRTFAMREILTFSAVILSMWEMQPAGDGARWKNPWTTKHVGGKVPIFKVKVWLKRRNLPQEK